MTPNARGALFMALSMAAFTANDTCVKLAGEALPLFQIVVIRGLLVSALLGLVARRRHAFDVRLSRGDWTIIALRAIAEAVSTFFFLTALMHMPLANVSAVLQMLPLTVTLGAALFYREAVGWRRMTAIAIGFLGMLLIVRPGPEGFSLYGIYALIAMVCVTARDLLTRRLSPAVPSMTVALSSGLGVTAFGLVASVGTDWVMPDAGSAALVTGAALLIFFGYLLSVMAMRVGDISFAAPFRYTGLLYALVLGWLAFGDWPDAVTLTGGVVVILSGLFTFHRQRVVDAES